MSTDPYAPAEPPPPLSGLAVASLVLGVAALALSPVVLGAVMAFVGMPLAILYLRRGRGHRAMAWWGLILATAGLVTSVGLGTVYYRLYREYTTMFEGHATTDDSFEETSEWVGMAAPALVVKTLDGQELDLTRLKGRRVVLNFWATWCAACREEMPHLDRLARETDDGELTMVAISDEDAATIRDYASKNGLQIPLASATGLPAPFDTIQALPTTVYIDRQGIIQQSVVGYQDYDTLRQRALATADYAGPTRAAGAEAAPLADLSPPTQPWATEKRWSVPVPSVTSVGVCDWDGDGRLDVVAADRSPSLHVFDGTGRETAKMALPEPAPILECWGGGAGTRVVTYGPWARAVSVVDGTGRPLWSFKTETGVNGAHWGDLDGDGRPELVVGLNGNGGLVGLGEDGRERWKVASIGNVWTQAVLPARGGLSAVVAATHAGGSVHLFDGDGSPTAELHPLQEYYTAVAAARTDAAGTVQVVAASDDLVVAFGIDGVAVWKSATRRAKGLGSGEVLGQGDLDGDGVVEWVFHDGRKGLVVASTAGQKLGEVPLRPGDGAFAVGGGAGGPGLLVTAAGGHVVAWSLRPVTPTPPATVLPSSVR